MDAQSSVDLVFEAELLNQQSLAKGERAWKNPSRHLVQRALLKWSEHRLRSDNTTVVCVMLDMPEKKTTLTNVNQEETTRTIYDYSTSEAYNLDYMESNSFDSSSLLRQNSSFNLVAPNTLSAHHEELSSYSFYKKHFPNHVHLADRTSGQLPAFSKEYQSLARASTLMDSIPSASADLDYNTNNDQSSFVKGCCPTDRYTIANANHSVHFHTIEQHREMYQTMAQQPFPPLHYAYRPILAYNNYYQNQVVSPPRPMERFNYLRPTETEFAHIKSYKETTNELEMQELDGDTDTEEMDWSDDDDDEEEEEEKEDQNDEEEEDKKEEDEEEESTKQFYNEAETNEDVAIHTFMEKASTEDDSIQIFEISSSNLGINDESNKVKTDEKPSTSKSEKSNNKENSESTRKKGNRIALKFYETRQKNRKMRSGNTTSTPTTGVQKTITKEKNQKRIVKLARKAIKTLQNVAKTSTSAALKKIEAISNVKAITNTSNKSKVNGKVDAALTVPSSSSAEGASSTKRVLRSSSQIDIQSEASQKSEVIKISPVRNLRRNDKSIQSKKNGKIK